MSKERHDRLMALADKAWPVIVTGGEFSKNTAKIRVESPDGERVEALSFACKHDRSREALDAALLVLAGESDPRDATIAQLRRDDLHPADSGARICDRPGCLAGIIRADGGTRHCAEGHPLRWVAIDSQSDMRAELQKLRAVAEMVKEQSALLDADADRFDSDGDTELAGYARHQAYRMRACITEPLAETAKEPTNVR